MRKQLRDMPCNTCAQISASKPLSIMELRAILHVTYQDMSRKLHNEDAMSKVGLMKAAELTGKSASTIHRAMKAGRLSFDMNEHGERVVDASELFRVFPPKASEEASEELRDEMPRNVARHNTQLAKTEVELRAEREKNAMLEQLLDEMRQERQAERREKERLLSILEKQTLLLPKPQEETPSKKPTRRWWHLS
jgi:hypothetical protein